MADRIPEVVIVGAGFGGLNAARALAKAPVHVTLIDRNNYHVFQPLLYQVATAGLSPTEIAQPVRSILRNQKNFDFALAEVKQVDLPGRCLLTNTCSYAYDYLILSVGGQTNTFGLENVAQFAFGLKGVDDAVRLRNHLLAQFEMAVQESDPARRKALLTFVAVGGGPTGVECSGAISELIRLVLSKDYPNLNIADVRVILLEATGRLLAGMPDRLAAFTARTLQKKHVEVRLNTAVESFDGQEVKLKNGEVIPTCTLIWAAGVRAEDLTAAVDAGRGRGGRLEVEPSLQLPGRPEVFVIGDAAYLTDPGGQPLPMVAPVAMQQAKVAAENVRRLVAGKALVHFQYKDPGMLATIGRNAAVAHIGRWQFTGFPAWVVWLVVHILQLIGFRNRLIVLINWVWDYLFYDRPIRMIEPD
jgi:NADH:ubiquinone reductase (H+-translocating)